MAASDQSVRNERQAREDEVLGIAQAGVAAPARTSPKTTQPAEMTDIFTSAELVENPNNLSPYELALAADFRHLRNCPEERVVPNPDEPGGVASRIETYLLATPAKPDQGLPSKTVRIIRCITCGEHMRVDP